MPPPVYEQIQIVAYLLMSPAGGEKGPAFPPTTLLMGEDSAIAIWTRVSQITRNEPQIAADPLPALPAALMCKVALRT